jgi:hypothetical protein
MPPGLGKRDLELSIRTFERAGYALIAAIRRHGVAWRVAHISLRCLNPAAYSPDVALIA